MVIHSLAAQLVIAFSNFVGLLVGPSMGGRCADIFGRRPVLGTALAVGGVATAACGVTRWLPFLSVCRFIAGFSSGASIPVTYAPIAENGNPFCSTLTASL